MGDYWNSENTKRIPAKTQAPKSEVYRAPLSPEEEAILARPLENYQDCVRWQEEITRMSRANLLPADLAEAMSKQIRTLIDMMKTRDQMNPEWQARSKFTGEAAIQAARLLTPERVKEILLGRKFKMLVEDMSLPGEAIPMPKVEDVVDVEVSAVVAPEAGAQTDEMKRNAEDVRQQMRDMVAEKRRQRGKE